MLHIPSRVYTDLQTFIDIQVERLRKDGHASQKYIESIKSLIGTLNVEQSVLKGEPVYDLTSVGLGSFFLNFRDTIHCEMLKKYKIHKLNLHNNTVYLYPGADTGCRLPDIVSCNRLVLSVPDITGTVMPCVECKSVTIIDTSYQALSGILPRGNKLKTVDILIEIDLPTLKRFAYDVRLGDVVSGRIMRTNIGQVVTYIDPRQYTSEYIDAIEHSKSETGLELDI